MGVSAWVIFAAPIMPTAMAEQPVSAVPSMAAPVVYERVVAGDIFSGETILDDNAMRDAAGGTGTDFTQTIGDIGVNIADNTGNLSDVNAEGANTGAITNLSVDNNSGVTAVLNNTGNGVIFQNTVQVNVFLNQGSGQ